MEKDILQPFKGKDIDKYEIKWSVHIVFILTLLMENIPESIVNQNFQTHTNTCKKIEMIFLAEIILINLQNFGLNYGIKRTRKIPTT